MKKINISFVLTCFLFNSNTFCQNISFNLLKQSEIIKDSNHKLFGGISAIDLMDNYIISLLISDTKEKRYSDSFGKILILVSDYFPANSKSYFFEFDGQNVSNGNIFNNLASIECIRFNKLLNKIFYSFENKDNTGVGYFELKPSVGSGKVLFQIPIPSQQTSDNRGIEGITFDKNNNLWMAFEADGNTNCGDTTISFYYVKYDSSSNDYNYNNKEEYHYPFYRCSCLSANQKFNRWIGNGVSEILALKDYPGKLLVLERCFDDTIGHVKLYLVTTQINSPMLSKELVFDFNDKSNFIDKDFIPDNLEGMAWGNEEDSSQILYIVSDNNFRSKQKNQIIKLKMVEANEL